MLAIDRTGGTLAKAFLAIVALTALLYPLAATASSPANTASEILEATDIHGGLVVHLNCGDGKLTAALGAAPNITVQGLTADSGALAAARDHVRSQGCYGQIAIERFDGKHLPYAENLVNLLVSEDQGDVPTSEILRVLAPSGIAYILHDGKWTKTVKPRPGDIDHWNHYLHDASGNAVAQDDEVAPPKHVHWIASPYWSRSHEFNPSLNAAVIDGGRLFYTLDEGIAGIPDTPYHRFPGRWSLIARDAHSGVLLWKRPIPNWGYREWNTVGMWSAPLTLQRRLVTDGRHVCFTFGYKAPVTILDAATGKTLHEVPNTLGADEMILAEGVLLVCVRDHLSVGVPPSTPPERRRNPHEYNVDAPGEAELVAIDVQSGRELWRRPAEPIQIVTLAALDGRAAFHDINSGLVCLDLATGETRWTAPCKSPGGSRHSGGTLVMHEDTIMYTGANGLTAFDAATGEPLWNAPRVSGPGISHPPDLFVANGLVWGGDEPGMHSKSRTRVLRQGRDPRTGEVRRSIEVANLVSPLHHFRCYRSKATDRFLLLTKRGVEYLDIQGDDHMRNDWLRAGCHYGFIPANGLLYVTPHHCFCYPGVKLNGFLALKGSTQPAPPTTLPRHERGEAYGQLGDHAPLADDAWPMYRHDKARSGAAGSPVATQLAKTWEAPLGGKLTQPVIADGLLVVAQVDAHTVHALNADDGSPKWAFTAGARIDSSPTLYRGRVLFGSRDGYVYCLRLSDGKLVWRFRAAPEDRRVVAFNQIESAWPVAGSVLVQNDTAYVAAGRSSFLDQGVHLFGLDPTTGEVRHRTVAEGPWPDPVNEVGRPFDMEGTKSDMLVGDGELIYLFQKVYDNQLNELDAPRMTPLGDREVGLHLMSTGGLVDYEWYDRTYWTYSRRWPGFYYTNDGPKAGQILVFDDETVYGLHVFRRRDRLSPAFTPGDGFELFADAIENEPVLTDNSAGREKGPGYSRASEPKWSEIIPLRVRGLVLAEDKLLMAGPPDVIPEDDPYAAYEGRAGSRLRVVDATSGETLLDEPIDAEPIFDGMSAAHGRLFMATTDGRVVCLGSE